MVTVVVLSTLSPALLFGSLGSAAEECKMILIAPCISKAAPPDTRLSASRRLRHQSSALHSQRMQTPTVQSAPPVTFERQPCWSGSTKKGLRRHQREDRPQRGGAGHPSATNSSAISPALYLSDYLSLLSGLLNCVFGAQWSEAKRGGAN